MYVQEMAVSLSVYIFLVVIYSSYCTKPLIWLSFWSLKLYYYFWIQVLLSKLNRVHVKVPNRFGWSQFQTPRALVYLYVVRLPAGLEVTEFVPCYVSELGINWISIGGPVMCQYKCFYNDVCVVLFFFTLYIRWLPFELRAFLKTWSWLWAHVFWCVGSLRFSHVIVAVLAFLSLYFFIIAVVFNIICFILTCYVGIFV